MAKEKTIQTNENITEKLFSDITCLVNEARNRVAIIVNREITILNWNIGKAINNHLLNNNRAEYGERIVATMSQQLTETFGKGFTKSALNRMINFYLAYSEDANIATLSQELSWSHFVELITIEDKVKRDFYFELSKREHWSVRTLRDRIDSMLFERTALSKKPENLISEEIELLKSKGLVTTDLVFKDPYVLDFLGLEDSYSESDLETAILNQLQKFIIELGSDFAFIARQKRITIDNEDFRIDLLFYHRSLRRLIAIDLKLDRFKAAYKGQMELYLKWLDKHERKENEETPIGLILCSEKQQEQIELLELDKGHIRVSQYLTQLPSKEILAQKLHRAIEVARAKRTD
ncbi:MAG TPA: PDDEXK nuclease domain-containing protein [Pedobacter sp.]